MAHEPEPTEPFVVYHPHRTAIGLEAGRVQRPRAPLTGERAIHGPPRQNGSHGRQREPRERCRMTPERWRQITELFHGAVAIGDAAARDAYLQAACNDDPSLRAEIDSLLAAQPHPTSSIDGPIPQEVSGATLLVLGTTLGPYRVEGLVGSGGMGEVYRARDTRLGRTVALKILPTHLRSKPQLLARFEREARVIAGLNHPYICTLHD